MRAFTKHLSVCVVWAVVVLLAVACGASNGGGARTAAHPTVKTCGPSSVAREGACPRPPVIPPGDGSSADGCRSDADCKQVPGGDGRCIKNPGVEVGLGAPPHAARTPSLLAEAPSAPRRTICVYDGCHADADCGPKTRCSCGSGKGIDRNMCVLLDQCVSDRDCPDSSLCLCGAGSPNVCTAGNCRTDGDCGSGLACEGSYCHTPQDTCRTNKDCAAAPAGATLCTYDVVQRAWGCRPVPPIPAG